MMKKVGLTAVALLTFGAVAEARPPRTSQIPNGNENLCLTCHNSSTGGSRNVFGRLVEASYLDAPGADGVVQWGPNLASVDSDEDGVTNGAELGDPQGTWQIGESNPPGPISNPGDPNSPNSGGGTPPTDPDDGGGCRSVGGQTVSWLLFGVGLAVWFGRRRRHRPRSV